MFITLTAMDGNHKATVNLIIIHVDKLTNAAESILSGIRILPIMVSAVAVDQRRTTLKALIVARMFYFRLVHALRYPIIGIWQFAT